MAGTLKQVLHAACLALADDRIGRIQQAMLLAAESANDDTKSTAGDKHETGRAMAHLEQEKIGRQLHEALELKRELLKIDSAQRHTRAAKGSVVHTSKGHFYLSVSAGKIQVNTVDFFALSPASPLGKLFMGCEKGSTVNFNGNAYTVTGIE